MIIVTITVTETARSTAQSTAVSTFIRAPTPTGTSRLTTLEYNRFSHPNILISIESYETTPFFLELNQNGFKF